MTQSLLKMAKLARQASDKLVTVPSGQKNQVLKDLATLLAQHKKSIINTNQKDMALAEKKGLSQAMLDRLRLNDRRIDDMRSALKDIIKLSDPVGEIVEQRKYHGLEIQKVRIPLGVICMIYESRPNVTVDAFSLCFKSGNAVILRGGSEAFHSNKILVELIQKALKKNHLNQHAVCMVPATDRRTMKQLLALSDWIDLAIPRGGEGLMRFISKHARVPVIKHDKGVCSIFVDESCRAEDAIRVIENAKVQRPGVCNAVETVYIHQKIAQKLVPMLCEALAEKGVEIRGDPTVRKLFHRAKKAAESDWSTEYLDLILAIKTVRGVHDAIRHVIKYSSHHTDCILTQNRKNAAVFAKALTSSCVMINTSTRFNDGGQLGLGAEIGISTTRLHAYGPMGLKELTATKFVVKSRYKTRT